MLGFFDLLFKKKLFYLFMYSFLVCMSCMSFYLFMYLFLVCMSFYLFMNLFF